LTLRRSGFEFASIGIEGRGREEFGKTNVDNPLAKEKPINHWRSNLFALHRRAGTLLSRSKERHISFRRHLSFGRHLSAEAGL